MADRTVGTVGIQIVTPDDGMIYENANFETGENCVLVSKAEVKRRAEFALMREALEAAATFIEVEWERRATDAVSRLGPSGIPAAKAAHEVLVKVRVALGRTE